VTQLFPPGSFPEDPEFGGKEDVRGRRKGRGMENMKKKKEEKKKKRIYCNKSTKSPGVRSRFRHS
jgi:hypothetical protein